MDRNWHEYLAPYNQAVDELKVKLRNIRSQYEMLGKHSPIEFVTGRVKPLASILDKHIKKGIPIEEMPDIAGIRMMCQFVEDIPAVVALMKQRSDFTVIEEKDYISETKESGYRSYHLIISYPVQMISGEKHIIIELQVRTLAMNFWATIEHSLNYKYNKQVPEEIRDRLKRAAEAAHQLDKEMSSIRLEIQEAQKIFQRKTEKDS